MDYILYPAWFVILIGAAFLGISNFSKAIIEIFTNSKVVKLSILSLIITNNTILLGWLSLITSKVTITDKVVSSLSMASF